MLELNDYQVLHERAKELGIGEKIPEKALMTKYEVLAMCLDVYDLATDTCQGEIDNLAFSIVKMERRIDELTEKLEKPIAKVDKPVSKVDKKEVIENDKNGEVKK